MKNENIKPKIANSKYKIQNRNSKTDNLKSKIQCFDLLSLIHVLQFSNHPKL